MSVTFIHAADVSRPPDEVFAYLVDLDHLPAWQRGVSVEHLGGPAGGIGGRFRKARRTLAGGQAFTLERTALDREARFFELTALDGALRGSIERWTVEPSGAGSRVRLEAPTRWSGPARVLGPLLNVIVDRILGREIRELKTILERPGGR